MTADRRYLIFWSEGERHAFLLEEVAEIMDPPEFYPIPKVPGHYAGIMNCHGRPTPVVDMRAFFKGGKSSATAGKVLVLERKIANLAILVADVEKIVVGPFPASRGDSGNGVVEFEGGTAKLIEPEELVAALEAEMNRPSSEGIIRTPAGSGIPRGNG